MRLVQGLLCVAIAVPAFAQRPAGASTAPIDLAAATDIVIRPVRNGSADVQYVEIRQTFTRSPGTTAAEFSVRGPGAPPAPDAPGSPGNPMGYLPPPPPPPPQDYVKMVDANGPVTMAFGGGWRAQRAGTYPVTVTYRAYPYPPGTRTNPSPMLRTAGGAVSFQGGSLFLASPDGVNYPATLRWDFSDSPAGSIATSGQLE